MSVRAMAWAKRVTVGSASGKSVLLCIADYADERGTAWPSQATIARETELTDRTVRAALSDLEAKGIIRREQVNREDGSRAADKLHLVMTTPPEAISGGAEAISPPPEEASPPPRKLFPHPPEIASGLTTFDPPLNQETPSLRSGVSGRATAQQAALALEEPKPPDKPASKGHRLPSDWQPCPSVIATGREEGLTDEQIERELRQFRDYWAGIAGDRGRKLDWSATARNWLRKASSRLPQARFDGAGRNRGSPVSTLELYRGAVAKVSNTSGIS